MANFTDDKINAVWQKAKEVEGYDKNKYRQDIAGAWIQKDKYGIEDDYGWEIDHKFPESLGGTDHTDNLQPLQWENNRKKSDTFPKFETVISSEKDKNIQKTQSWHFKDMNFFRTLYPNNQYLKDIKL
jgi:5-methylcytosine-specific restriction endonuclease McrA